MAKILSIGPDHEVLMLRNRELMDCGHHVRGAETRAGALELARSGVFEIILLCDQLLPAYAAKLADELQMVAPGATILVLAGHPSGLTGSQIQALIAEQPNSSAA